MKSDRSGDTYTIPINTRIERWDDVEKEWSPFITTKAVIYTKAEAHYEVVTHSYLFKLPESAYPYTIIRVEANSFWGWLHR